MRRCALVLIMLTLLAGCSQQRKAFVWERIDSTAVARADGTLAVSETLRLRYTGGPFTFAFRDLPDRRIDTISNIRVEDATGALQPVSDDESTTPRTFSVSENDGTQRVRWVYAPATDTTQTFVLRYDVAGAVRRYADHDQIWWSIVFPDREEIVEQARGSIQLPSAVAPEQMKAGTPDFAGSIELVAGSAMVQAANIDADRELSLKLDFPKNVVGGSLPGWQPRQDAQDQYDATLRPQVNIAVSLLAAIVLLGLSAWAWLWYRGNRDPQVEPLGPIDNPPSDLTPAEAASLLGSASNQGVLGMLFDLANRGFVRFEERTTRWQSRTLHAIRQPHTQASLAPYEQQVLDALFHKANDVAMDGTNTSLMQAIPKLDKTVESALLARNLYEPAARARRTRVQSISFVMLFVGIALAVVGALFARQYSFWLPSLGIAVTIGSAAWLIAAGNIKGLTLQGADLFARWKSFQRFLTEKSSDARMGQFDRLVPFAVAIGNPGHFTQRYSATSEPLPIWYIPIISNSAGAQSSGGAGSPLLLHDFSQNFVSSLSGASSVAGDSGASSGGGGASGGGGGGAG